MCYATCCSLGGKQSRHTHFISSDVVLQAFSFSSPISLLVFDILDLMVSQPFKSNSPSLLSLATSVLPFLCQNCA